jgi:NAD(P)-dependent dehydrogenase (short-subunit alcohol dehydrogenase family)
MLNSSRGRVVDGRALLDTSIGRLLTVGLRGSTFPSMPAIVPANARSGKHAAMGGQFAVTREGRAMTPNDDWGLTGKVAIVTGGGAAGDGIGNGRAACILLARAGARVLVVDRDLPLAERTVSMIAAEGGNAAAAAYDVTESSQCAAMVADAIARWGRLDCLDNNVGIGSKGSVVEETEENWARVMQVNVDSMFLTCKHAIPEMVRTAGGGAIVNISSISTLRPRGLTAYSVSKGAVIALTKAMAVDHGAQGIRVNCVFPGPVYTRGMTAQARETRRNASVLGREGTGWDIGAAVRFLLSDQAQYITGQILGVDGGATLVGPSRAS